MSNGLISREALKDIAYINKGNFNTVEGIREWIDNAPDAPVNHVILYAARRNGKRQQILDAVRPKGEWICDVDLKWHCSICHDCIQDIGSKEWVTSINQFCKYCGADMRGDKA